MKQRRSSRIILNPFLGWFSFRPFWDVVAGVQEGQQSGETHLGPIPLGVGWRPLQEVSQNWLSRLELAPKNSQQQKITGFLHPTIIR